LPGETEHVAGVTISSLSLEYVRVPVFAKEAGVVVNPTTDAVVMAFKSDGTEPVTNDWKASTWETDSTTTPATYYARCLVGTGGTVALTDGTYDVWVRVTDSPEIPVRKAGRLVVT
jgi:hypothetical protein